MRVETSGMKEGRAVDETSARSSLLPPLLAPIITRTETKLDSRELVDDIVHVICRDLRVLSSELHLLESRRHRATVGPPRPDTSEGKGEMTQGPHVSDSIAAQSGSKASPAS